MLKLFDRIYNEAYRDDWAGSLIGDETAKVHATIRQTISDMVSIIQNVNSTPEDRAWARSKIDELTR